MIFISELHKDIVCGHVHVYGHTHRKSIWLMNTDAKPFNKMPSKKLAVVPGQWSVSQECGLGSVLEKLVSMIEQKRKIYFSS